MRRCRTLNIFQNAVLALMVTLKKVLLILNDHLTMETAPDDHLTVKVRAPRVRTGAGHIL